MKPENITIRNISGGQLVWDMTLTDLLLLIDYKLVDQLLQDYKLARSLNQMLAKFVRIWLCILKLVRMIADFPKLHEEIHEFLPVTSPFAPTCFDGFLLSLHSFLENPLGVVPHISTDKCIIFQYLQDN